MLAILSEAALRSFLLGAVVWVGLTLLRVRNPQAHMTACVAVLFVSLSMPLLMHSTLVTITLAPSSTPTTENFWTAESSLPDSLQAPRPSKPDNAMAAPGKGRPTFNWWNLATTIYTFVAGLLLFRLAVGIYFTWRLARAAKRMDEPWVSSSDVRISEDIGGPVTFGSTILVPPQCIGWGPLKRQAVLAHEGAHVANRDFYILLLASVNRAVFWFSPFAWWQASRLAEFAEIISDARAIEALDDKWSYAEILLELVQHTKPGAVAIEMARACTVRTRVERILAAAAPVPDLGWRKRFWIAAAIVPVVTVSAGMIAHRTGTAPLFVLGDPENAMLVEPKWQAVDFYSFGSTSVFAIFREGDDLFGQLTGQRRIRLSEAPNGTYSYPARAGQINFVVDAKGRPSELTIHQNGRDLRAAWIAAMPRPSSEVDATHLDRYVGWYELTPYRVLKVTHDGDRVHAEETGRAVFEVSATGADTFSNEQEDLIFLRDGQDEVTGVLLEDSMSGARRARRVDAATAKLIEEAFAQRIAEVPDRFREQIPAPGSKEAILRGIADMQRGTPNYDRMSAALAANIRRQVTEMHAIFLSLGAVDSIYFRGVSPFGYDIYGVKFANGSAEIRLLLGPDGKADDVIFRPDGNEEPGGIAACSDEAHLGSPGGNAPIRILINNSTGDDIQLYSLDSKGNRTAHGMIGDSMSSSILTQVDASWLIANRAGQCLEIVRPGQRTRYHTVAAVGAGALPDRPALRTTPVPDGEEMLREFIFALGQGHPNYNHMTPEVAVQTHQQLPFDQAILAKLGALRALSFRGVTALGSDIYIAQFANGSAEWRIGLTKSGAIGRIALGPQY